MIALLKYRIVFITLLFGAFGSALPALLKIDELQWYYTSLTPLLALLVSFLISFLIKAKWNIQLRNRLKIAAALLFLLLLVAVFFHTRLYLDATFRYKDFTGNEKSYVKGEVYTPLAIEFKKSRPDITSDAVLLYEGFGGPEGKQDVWTQESIDKNILSLIITYCLVVIIFVAALTLLSEILSQRYAKHKRHSHTTDDAGDIKKTPARIRQKISVKHLLKTTKAGKQHLKK